MDSKRFNLWNWISAAAAFVVSAVTYLCTMEPSASFWDCGEFIASSYKLEVGHPPGNPVFQLFARIFTIFGDSSSAAVLVNSMSAICSALTIFFLYLTIVWFVRRMIQPDAEGKYSTGAAIAIFGSGLVGSLAYCFSDTFWFSAVEGEVYAMSSLFTALVFWAMTVWYDKADEPHANRWIVLIAFLMGLSIGVHLLNLLAIPALVFMYFFRQKPDYTFWEYVKIFLVGVVILAVILFAIIPWLPKIAAYFDLFFVNSLGLPYNSGAAFFMVALLAGCFWGMFETLRREKVLANTILMCFTVIIIGFSIFTVDIIRSAAKTPTNEYQPDNAFTLVRYLSREQYGKTPLIYGQYYDAPYELKSTKYWAPIGGKYKKVDGPVDASYLSSGKMLFPRMWSNGGEQHTDFYEAYTHGKGKKIAGSQHRKPTMGANLLFFFDYQMNWMYWRYFMWNFVGRQNDVHSPSPGNIFHGNWESGVGFIDKARLGDQSDAPAVLAQNKGKNHYYFLPLILGLIGLCFQFGRDKRGCWLNFLMFFMTGIAIVLYLNQPPYQVRERDYAYAGSFYFFAVWIGLAVAALWQWISEKSKDKGATVSAAVISVACLFVPALMAAQNWDDHDRSNRRTAVELASNYLNSVGENGYLVTHGDNDTFPLWYAQEVESIRTDVRICNTSLLGTDWHIDQMKYAVNESKPIPLAVPNTQYLYGTNEYVPIVESHEGQVMDIHDVMKIFRHPQLKVPLSSGKKVDYLPARKIRIDVNRENVLASGILSEKFADQIPESIVITIPKGKEYISKPELFMLDLLDNYDWSRPLHMLNMGGDINIGLKEYLMYCGYSYKFVPLKNKPSSLNPGLVDEDELYRKMTSVYRFDAVSRDDYFVDYQNIYTNLGVMSIRQLHCNAANAFLKAGQKERALEMVDRGLAATASYPLETIPLGFQTNDYMVIEMANIYYRLGEKAKGDELAARLGDELLAAIAFYADFYEYASETVHDCADYLMYLQDVVKRGGSAEIADRISESIEQILGPMAPED